MAAILVLMDWFTAAFETSPLVRKNKAQASS
jgi:hypothetical protein